MCPVCKRDLAPTLSICLTCGAMINDTVREELETKISRTAELATSNSGRLAPKPLPAEQAVKVDPPKPVQPSLKMEAPKIEAPKPMVPPANPMAPPAKPIAARYETGDLRTKKTSKTLVEFQTKKATVPEWRLQLQNSVRQKVGTNRREGASDEATPTPQCRRRSGARAWTCGYRSPMETLSSARGGAPPNRLAR